MKKCACVFSVLFLVSTGFGEALKLDGSNYLKGPGAGDDSINMRRETP
jgi:hypothetical protein